MKSTITICQKPVNGSMNHEQLELLPIFRHPFDSKLLPNNGIYFFYEEGENSDHGNGISRSRIVRIGTHKENNFRSSS
jgi:hypothetical protein